MMSLVSLLRCDRYEDPDLQRGVRDCLEPLGGIESLVKPGDRVLLKPNLLAGRVPEAAVTTHPAVVRAVARMVLDAGGMPIIGDSPAIEPFARVAKRSGMAAVAEELGIEIRELLDPVRAPEREGVPRKRLELASLALEADVVLNLPKLKTHGQMLLTLGVKNLYGTVVAQRKAEWHYMVGLDRDAFASLLLQIYGAVRPALTLLDGIQGMEGHGPANGRPRHLGILAASRDAVALDVSICRLLGVPLEAFPLYRAARALGIGESDPARIELIGLKALPLGDTPFEVPRLDSLRLLPSFLDGLARRHLVSRPLVSPTRCQGCGKCAEICPAGAMAPGPGRVMRIAYDACIRCYCCQEICPRDAIRFEKGYLLRLMELFRR